MFKPFLLGFETEVEAKKPKVVWGFKPFLLGFETEIARRLRVREAVGSNRSFWDLKPLPWPPRSGNHQRSNRSFWDLKLELTRVNGERSFQVQTVPSGI